ncbi:L-serine ammonia-lyase [Bacteroidota bacterium]
MERISVFDIFKIGIGPSSSHTMGPWKAALLVKTKLEEDHRIRDIVALSVTLYGSLAKTGKGHGTDIAILLGLSGENPETIPVESISEKVNRIYQEKLIRLNKQHEIRFDPEEDLEFEKNLSLSFHPNGMTFDFQLKNGESIKETFYSIGGGFIIQENRSQENSNNIKLRYPIDEADDLHNWTKDVSSPIHKIVFENERSWRSDPEIRSGLLHIWEVMQEAIIRGCFTEGILPGGLGVKRRAAGMVKNLTGNKKINRETDLIPYLKSQKFEFRDILSWVSSFALAVNEENASFGRIVTAPTNGAAGVIPAVLMYYNCFVPGTKEEDIVRFLLTAGEIGSIFKKGATISAAMGGCQAEIGVSSAMAASALTECMGGSPDQAIMAAEIAMEHHLGLTCDPIGGLVQVPCIERNTMGAIKAITASQLALSSIPENAKVSLDGCIKTMKETAKDMDSKYKETADGGLAVNISVNIPDC